MRLNNYQTTPDNNLLRVDCPLNMTEVELGLPITPVEGTLCFFGQIPGTYAGNFDVNGSFWCGGGGEFRMDGMDGGGVRGKRDGKNVWFSKRFLKDAWEFLKG